MNDEYDDQDISPEELDAVIRAALGDLLNIATQAGDMQRTDEAADEIYNICDLIAEYYEIERAQCIVEENADGSYTTRFEPVDAATTHKEPNPNPTSTGVIRTKGKVKYRIINDEHKPKKQ